MNRTPSVLAPAGVEAAILAEVSTVLIAGAALVFVGMLALLAFALHGRRTNGVPIRRWVIGGGIVLPAGVLIALLVYATTRTATLARHAAPDLVVNVTGRSWWWDLRYRDPASGRSVAVANELRLPAGRRVRLGLQSADVIHSLWIPELGGKMDLVPGRVNHLTVTATRPGVYRGLCAEFCGAQHARMGLVVVVMPAPAFDAWLRATAVPTETAAADGAAASPLVERGAQAFRAHGCAVCHAVTADAPAPGLGPSLVQVGLRHTLGAGVLRNDAGALRQWLVDVQRLKPGARMPSYAHLDGATLDALAAYLATLR